MVHGQARNSGQSDSGHVDSGQADNGQADNGQANDSSNIDVKFSSPVAVRDVQAVALARRQNIATNGRLFCMMLFCVCLLLWLFSPDNLFMWLALFSTLPVAGAVVADVLAGSIASSRANSQAASRNDTVAAGQADSTFGLTAGNAAGNTPREVAHRQAENFAANTARNTAGTSSRRRALGALHAAVCGVNAGVPVAVFIITLLNIG